jgi:hypothetical protein
LRGKGGRQLIEIQKAIEDGLKLYASSIEVETARVVKKNLAIGVADLKLNAPFTDRTGEYRESFKTKIIRENNGLSGIIYSEQYWLTHLLEDGHASTLGGRTRAFPHWEPMKSKVTASFIDDMRGVAKG